VPRTSWQEKKRSPDFLEAIAAYALFDIVPGNHDGDIEALIPEKRHYSWDEGFCA